MNLEVVNLGIISFKEAFSQQIQIHQQVVAGLKTHTLILCEHPHTITLGRQAKISNIIDYKPIKNGEVDLIVGLNRGGDITYHGPGQLMGYFIFDLRQFNRDLGWFLNRIEAVLIDTLVSFGLFASTRKGFRGIWIGENKIASIGIGIDRWVSMHGFGLNVNTDLNYFDLIKPCGLNVKMTSMKKCLGKHLDMDLVNNELVKQVNSNFEQVKLEKYIYAEV